MTETTLPVSPLTPAERLEVLMDAVTLFELHRRNCDRLARRLHDDAASDEAFNVVLREPIEAEITAQEALIEHIRSLMADGLLERCASLLQIGGAKAP